MFQEFLATLNCMAAVVVATKFVKISKLDSANTCLFCGEMSVEAAFVVSSRMITSLVNAVTSQCNVLGEVKLLLRSDCELLLESCLREGGDVRSEVDDGIMLLCNVIMLLCDVITGGEVRVSGCWGRRDRWFAEVG